MYIPEILNKYVDLKNKVSELFLTASMIDFKIEVKEWLDTTGYHVEIGLVNDRRYLCFIIDIVADKVNSCFIDPDTCAIHGSRNFNDDPCGPIEELYKKLAII